MSEQPRVGDRAAPKEIDRADVLGELEHRFETVTDDLPVIGRVLDELAELDILRFREPADDPSKSLVGEVRREEHDKPNDSPGFSLWQKVVMPTIGAHPGTERQRWLCVLSSAPGNRGDYLDDEDVVGIPVIGYVPGTPAEQAQAADNDPLTPEYRAHLSHFQPHADCGFCPPSESRVDPHKPDVLIQADTSVFEPKVWHSDGPEPAEHVKALEWLDSNPGNRWSFLVRSQSGWAWTRSPDDTPAVRGAYWDDATRACPGRYREVQP